MSIDNLYYDSYYSNLSSRNKDKFSDKNIYELDRAMVTNLDKIENDLKGSLNFTCPICLNFLVKSVECPGCENRICEKCETSLVPKKCPSCRLQVSFKQCSRAFKNVINLTEIICPKACSKTVNFDGYIKHLEICPGPDLNEIIKIRSELNAYKSEVMLLRQSNAENSNIIKILKENNLSKETQLETLIKEHRYFSVEYEKIKKYDPETARIERKNLKRTFQAEKEELLSSMRSLEASLKISETEKENKEKIHSDQLNKFTKDNEELNTMLLNSGYRQNDLEDTITSLKLKCANQVDSINDLKAKMSIIENHYSSQENKISNQVKNIKEYANKVESLKFKLLSSESKQLDTEESLTSYKLKFSRQMESISQLKSKQSELEKENISLNNRNKIYSNSERRLNVEILELNQNIQSANKVKTIQMVVIAFLAILLIGNIVYMSLQTD
jgi:hypothetical protein